MRALTRLAGAADRLQRRWPPLAFPVAVWRKFGDDKAGDLAALIAYYAFVAIFPLLLVLVTVLDIAARHDPALRQRILGSALRAYPVIGPQLGSSVHPLRSTGIALAVGLVVALLGARGVAMAVQDAMNALWAVPADRRPAFPWSALRGLGFVVVVGLGQVLLTTVLSAFAAGLSRLLPGVAPHAGAIALSFVLNIGLFWVALRLATAAEVSWRDLRLAALLAAACWQVLQVLGGYIVTHMLARSSALYGAFGVVLGLLAWLYLQAQVTLYAVEACTVRARGLWPRRLLPADAKSGLTERREDAMTVTGDAAVSAGRGAGPVDFGTYGDYGDYRRREDGTAGSSRGEFVRAPYPFRGRITADGSSGYPAEAGRYHLYVSWACPWAQRAAIVRRLMGLADVISLGVVDPVRDGRGWAFREGDGHGLDEVNGFAFLREAYEATEPGYAGHISVPVLWDTRSGVIVSNNFPDITIDLETQFGRWADPSHDLYPERLRSEIDEINELVYATVNNGVYRCGFAASQAAYHEAVTALFGTLDQLDARLAGRRYLMGDALTEADVRLWVTLARFDAVYYSHFKANLRRLTDYPALWRYARELYALPAFRETTNFDHIKRHYYVTQGRLNPSRIVPEGPLIDWTPPGA